MPDHKPADARPAWRVIEDRAVETGCTEWSFGVKMCARHPRCQCEQAVRGCLPPRDEARIRHNLARYHEAVERWRIYSHRAQDARRTMDSALADLRAVGGTAEAERLTNG